MGKTKEVTPQGAAMAYSHMCPKCGRALISIFRPQTKCPCGWVMKGSEHHEHVVKRTPVAKPDRVPEIVPMKIGRVNTVHSAEISMQIRETRERLGMTKNELGRRIGVYGTTIGAIERGARFPRHRYDAIMAVFAEAERAGRDKTITT